MVTFPEVVAHAGLAIQRPGGTPTRRHLDEALGLGVERLELDICCTADGRLVLRHDTDLADGTFVGDLTLDQLRRADRFTLTLDEVSEHLAGRVAMLLDLKMARVAEMLGPWCSRRQDLDDYAICTENIAWLLHLRFAVPRVARWLSFPDLGDSSTHHVRRVAAALWRSHASLAGLRRGVSDIHRAAMHLRHNPHESLARLGGLPWRERLPLEIDRPCADIGAAGLCVQQWLVSPALVDAGHRLGLHVNTWTVNHPAAAPALAAAGVDSITTDRVEAIRMVLGIDRPRLPVRPPSRAQGGGA